MTLNYDVENNLGLDKIHNEVSDDDIDVYGVRVISGPKKNRLKELIKKNACTIAGIGCFAVFTISSIFMIFNAMEKNHADQTNQVLDMIESIAPPELYLQTPTFIPSMAPTMSDMMNIPRPPRRRRY